MEITAMAIMRRLGLAFGLAALAVPAYGRRAPAQTAGPAEARGLFERFVAAQNAHDAAAVEAMLWNSPDFLWITRGAAIWGREAAMERFRALYLGTWRLEPEMAQFRAMTLGEGTAQLFVPVLFTIGAAGQPAQPTPFLMNQMLRREGNAWQIASILPIPRPPS
jgi:ketosteroid isomerase-like protein